MAIDNLDSGLNVDCSKIKIGSTSNDLASALSLSNPSFQQMAPTITCTQDLVFYLTLGTGIPAAASEVFVYIEAGTGVTISGTEIAEDIIGSVVTMLSPDTTSPEIDLFTLDLTKDELLISFSEAVDINSFNPSLLVLQSTATGGPGVSSPTASYQLTTNSMTIGDNGLVVSVQLNQDANGIKLVSGLAVSRTSTFLSASAGMVSDLSGNVALAATPLQATTYITDIIPPTLVAFNFSLLSYKLQLEFDEPVLAASLQPNAITIQSTSSDDTISFQLTTESVASLSNAIGNLLVIDLNGDGESLELAPNLANDLDSTFLTCESNLIEDIFGNPVAEIISSNALQVSTFTPGLGPQLDSFSLDLTKNELVLTFSEQVVISSVVPTAIVIQSTADGSGTSVTLTGLSTVVPGSVEAATVAIALNGDANALKKNLGLATSSSDTFLSWSNNLANNLDPEDVIPRDSSNALAVNNYTHDNVNPELQAFVLDLDTDRLEMTFNEPIIAGTINSSRIMLLYNLTSPNIAVNDFVNVTNTTVVSDVLTTLIFDQSLNEMKAYYAMDSSGATAYIRFVEGAFLDTNSNSVGVQTIQGTVVMDESLPQLEAFNLDLNVGTITLNLNEVIDISSLNIAGSLSLLRELSDVHPYTLTGGIIPVRNNLVIMISLLKTDLNAIKAMTNLATNASNTFIAINEMLLQDLNGNAVVPTVALPVSAFIEDTTPPTLVFVHLDLNNKDIKLTFDEPVEPSSINITSLTFVWRKDDGSNTTFSITGGSISTTNFSIVTIQMTLSDFNFINCFTSQTFDAESNTFLQIETSAVLDSNGNPIQKEVVAVNQIVANRSPLNLINFDIDLNRGVLDLTFDESIVPSTFVSSQITVQSMVGPNSQAVTLTNESVSTSTLGPELVIVLSTRDLNEIKRSTNVATMTSNTYISLGGGVVEDCGGDPATALNPSSALQASRFVPDTTRPKIVYFNLDLDEGELVLLFSEVVNVSSFTPTAIAIQRFSSVSTPSTSIQGAEQFLVLTSGTIKSSDDLEITLSLNTTDLFVLQKSSEVAVDENTTFLSMDNTAISDTSGNRIIQIPSNEAIQVNVFSADAPDILQSEQGGKFVALSWSVPIGPTILKYIVKWERSTTRECPDKDIGALTLSNDRTSIIIQGLEEDSAYNIIVESYTSSTVTTSDPFTIITLETGKFC